MDTHLQALLLIAAGAGVGLLTLLVVLGRTVARREKTGFWDLFLIFLTTTLPVLALIFDHQTPDAPAQPLVANGALVIAGVLGAASLLIMLLELLRPQRLRDSRGVLVLWSALLVAVSTFTVPLIAENLVTTPEPVTVAAVMTATQARTETTSGSASPTERPAATATVTASPTPSPEPSPTTAPTERPTASPTPTRRPFVYSSPTPEPAPTLPTPCVGSVLYNLRLRSEPDPEAETLLTIPFNTTLTLFGKDAPRQSYWYTTYEDTEGWVDASYVQAASACDNLPVWTGR